jgi:23S rRNA (adenine1618-N6)-methyltransferase
MWRASISTGVGFSEKAVWSRASRRQVARKQGDAVEDDDPEMTLGFKIHVEPNEINESGTKVTIRWLKGHDTVLFESFCGMLKRELEDSKK